MGINYVTSTVKINSQANLEGKKTDDSCSTSINAEKKYLSEKKISNQTLLNPIIGNKQVPSSKQPTKSNKENFVQSEASTQTSFVIPVATVAEYNQLNVKQKFLTDSSNQNKHHQDQFSNEIEMKRKMRNEKIQKLIQLEKIQHEKRLRELEKLAHLER
jgi:hypothetical protein